MADNSLVRFNDAGTQDLFSLSQIFAQSRFFQDASTAAQAVVKIYAGRELGVPPVAAMTGIYMVKGKITLSANLIAALIKRSNKYNYKIKTHTNELCEIEFFESGNSVGFSSFSLAEARAAKLAGGDNWSKYPKNMLFARAISNGAKWFCADIFSGPIYSTEETEMADIETGEVKQVRVVTPNGNGTPAYSALTANAAAILKPVNSSFANAKQLEKIKQAETLVGVETVREVLREVTGENEQLVDFEPETLSSEEAERVLTLLRERYAKSKEVVKETPELVGATKTTDATVASTTVSAAESSTSDVKKD
jgi:hypothetical protein